MVLYHRDFKCAYDHIGTSTGKDKHLVSLNGVISDCDSTLQELESILKKVADGGRIAGGVMQRLRLQFKSPEIAMIQGQIQHYQKAIELGL